MVSLALPINVSALGRGSIPRGGKPFDHLSPFLNTQLIERSIPSGCTDIIYRADVCLQRVLKYAVEVRPRVSPSASPSPADWS